MFSLRSCARAVGFARQGIQMRSMSQMASQHTPKRALGPQTRASASSSSSGSQGSSAGFKWALGSGLAAMGLAGLSYLDDNMLHAFTRENSQFANMRLFSGSANPELSKSIAENLGINLSTVDIKSFNDGEIGIRVKSNVRGKDVFIVQPTCPPDVNGNIVELLLMVSTMRRASAKSITAIVPYYGYARQDRKMASRVPISSADVSILLQAMGADRVVAVDLHCGQIQGFFDPRVPCDNMESYMIALPYFKDLGLKNLKVISPDAGGVYRAKQFLNGMISSGADAGFAMIIKQRKSAGQISEMDLVGDVDGCDVVIIDDMIDTAGTLTKAAAQLKERGAKRVYAYATHGLFSGPAYERIGNSCLEKVVVTNTIPLREGAPSNIEQLQIGPLLSDAIECIHTNTSLSALFTKKRGAKA